MREIEARLFVEPRSILLWSLLCKLRKSRSLRPLPIGLCGMSIEPQTAAAKRSYQNHGNVFCSSTEYMERFDADPDTS
jgi:YHS domain-containing protein